MRKLKKLFICILVFSAVAIAGLISAQAVSVAYGAGTVSCQALNIRAEAGTDAAITGTLRQGDTVVILENDANGWYHINSGGAVGYVSSLYITGVETAKNFTAAGTLTGTDIRMRGTPSTSGDILGTYGSGTVMNVIGINSGWYKVTYDGQTGYIRSDFMTLTGKTAPAPSKAASLGQKIADFAYQFVGYPYVYGAESPDVGFDCSGLCYYVYGHFGYDICRTASQQYKNDGVSVSKADLQPGDLVFFSSDGEGVTHVGLYYGNGKFVNASTSSVGVIFSDINSDYYTRVWWGAKRIIK